MKLEFGKGELAGIDLTDPKVHEGRDLREAWAHIRKTQPIVWHPHSSGGFWVVTRYEDVRRIYLDKEKFTSVNGNVLETLLSGGDPASGKMLALSDGPRHLMIRGLLQKSIKPSVLNDLNEVVHRNAMQRMEPILNGDCDFASAFAQHIPLDTVCHLMGIESIDDRDRLHSYCSNALASNHADVTEAESKLARNEILMFFADLIESKRVNPGDDIVSEMLRLEAPPVNFSYEELLYNCYSFLIGGDETARLSIICMVKLLAEHPAIWERLKNGEFKIGPAVEEFFRWATPAMHVGRTVTQNVVVGDTTFQAGQIVSLWNSSANFDENAFAQPYDLVLDRKPNAHLAFGFGSHFCLGAMLARTELSAVLQVLIKNVDTIRMIATPKRIFSNFMSGYWSLPVHLTGKA